MENVITIGGALAVYGWFRYKRSLALQQGLAIMQHSCSRCGKALKTFPGTWGAKYPVCHHCGHDNS